MNELPKNKIELVGNTVTVYCPCCDNWEELNVDETRDHLGSFDILEWKKDTPNKNEVSAMYCFVCNNRFELEWDYTPKTEYNYLSPDQFTISPDFFETKEAADEFLDKWIKQYEQQGYYSSMNGPIALSELKSKCTLIEHDVEPENEDQ